MSATDASSNTTMRLTRRFAASRERVYAAFTDPELGVQWWAPEGHTLELVLDARPGGTFRYSLVNDETGDKFVSEGVYREATPPERLVWTNSFADGEGKQTDTLVTLELVEVEGGTEVTVSHERFRDAAMRDAHAGGWGSSLDRLRQLLGG